MSTDLPTPIQHYFAADQNGSKTIGQCFTQAATVKDEGKSHRGPAAIEQWKADSARQYTYTAEPFACEQKEGQFVVKSRVSGNFPGSPIDLRYFFALEGDKIASLEIRP